jgi:hypothetical protein
MSTLSFRFGAALALALVTTGMAQAADDKGSFAVRGVGGQSCKAFVQQVEAKDAKTIAASMSWLMGYLSYANRASKGTYDTLPTVNGSEALGLVLTVCKNAKDSLVEAAAQQVLTVMAPAKVASESPLVEVKAEKGSVKVRKATVIAAQRALKAKGLFKPEPDGAYGPQTMAAVKAFQKGQKLAETGLLDIDTLIRLLVAKA